MSLEDERRRQTAKLRAMAHPVRLRVLSLLTGSALSAAEVARELGLTHANASYHLRQLFSAGTIELAEEEKIRGGAAKRYRYNIDHDSCDSDDPVATMPSRDTQQMYEAVAAELRRRSRQMRPARGRNHLTDAELWVDPAVWEKIRNEVTELSQTLHRAAQPPRTEGTILVNATFAMFEMSPA